MTSPGVAIRVLGPLEVRIHDEAVPLAGGKQRTVLALLLLRAGKVVSADELVDELWGERPPASAAHTLEVYVSRLRQLLNGYGPSLVRRGTGYALELGGAALDVRDFAERADDVSRAAAEGRHELVAEQSSAALALWRGKVLADVELGPVGRTEADRLDELRLRTTELRMDAELALGRHEQTVGELRPLVAQNPYRERFIGQLMLALYRSGRHAEALDVYEQMRRRLDDDLGLQPSVDLQQLSARMVRQDRELDGASPAPPDGEERSAGTRARRVSVLAVAAAVGAAIAALGAAGAARQNDGAPASSVGRHVLVVQEGRPDDPGAEWRRSELSNALVTLGTHEDVEWELLPVREQYLASDLERVGRQLRSGNFDLAVFGMDTSVGRLVAPVVRQLPRMRSVFLGTTLGELGLGGVPNANAVRFALEQPAQLAGALSGLLSPYGTHGRARADMVSVVASEPTPETTRMIAAFRKGFSRALPAGKLRVDYTHERVDPTACERAANAQIDAGSDVVLALSGRCGTGAVGVARTRGVWAISGDVVARPERHVVGAIIPDWDNSLYSAVDAFARGTLPGGSDIALTLDGYNVILEMRNGLPVGIASKVVRLCSSLRLDTNERTIPTVAES